MERIFSRSKPLAISWFIIMSVLLFLPGSTLPSENWMDAIYLDKWMHCSLFAGLVFLSSLAFDLEESGKIWLLVLASIVYGIVVEIVQKEWVAGRSFDLYDVVADAVGGILGWFVWLRVYKKNKPL